MNELERYVKALGECLEKRSVEELDNFIEKNKKFFDNEIYTNYIFSSRAKRELTLCNMIQVRTDISIESKEWAAKRKDELVRF